MRLRNTVDAWGGVAQGLHWLVAVLVLGMMVLGWVMVYWPQTPLKFELYSWHKSFGVTVFSLMLLRLGWRALNPVPALPAGMPRREARAAQTAHVLLYVALFVMPISGYVLNSATNFPLSVFGWFTIPNIVPEDEATAVWAGWAHLAVFWLIATLLVLHIGGALRHHFVLRDGVLRRMLPGQAKTAHQSEE